MTTIKARRAGLSAPLASGAKVFGSLSLDAAQTYFELTSAEGVVTPIALSHEAIAAMVGIHWELLKKEGAEDMSPLHSLFLQIAALESAYGQCMARQREGSP